MKIKVKIHYLFYAVAFAYLCVGKFYTFIIYVLSDILHEVGHAVVACKYGVRLNEILLMPYGAVASGNTDNLNTKRSVAVSLSGPFANALLCLFFITLWWLFPESYAFTDEIVWANFGLFSLNLLPVYGLDGGRVAERLMCLKLKESVANGILKAFAVLLGGAFVALFAFSLKSGINFSFLLFGVYLLLSPFTKNDGYKYVKISEFLSVNLPKGAKVNGIAINENAVMSDLLNCLDVNAYNVVYVYSDMKLTGVLDQAEIIKKCKENPITATVKDMI